MFDLMRKTVERNLCKSVAGQLITCPACDDIMDCRETVVVSIHKPDGAWVGTRVLCTKCWMRKGWSTLERVFGAQSEAIVEVIDGRTLFPNRRGRARRAKCAGCKVLYARATMFRQRAVKGVWCEACYMGPILIPKLMTRCPGRSLTLARIHTRCRSNGRSA
jgi:hypothetical protein